MSRLSSGLRLAALVFTVAAASTSHAGPIDFESLTDSEHVTTQYAGLVFSHATALTSGVSLNELEFPPHSGQNVVFDDGGAITLTLLQPATSVSAYFTYVVPLTLDAFDASHTLLGSVTSAFASNAAVSGSPGSTPNELLSLAFAGIAFVTIAGDAAGSSFVMDDLTVTSRGTTGVPEPSVLALLVLPAGLLLGRRRRVRHLVQS